MSTVPDIAEADCRLPIADLELAPAKTNAMVTLVFFLVVDLEFMVQNKREGYKKKIGNWQSEIGNG